MVVSAGALVGPLAVIGNALGAGDTSKVRPILNLVAQCVSEVTSFKGPVARWWDKWVVGLFDNDRTVPVGATPTVPPVVAPLGFNVFL